MKKFAVVLVLVAAGLVAYNYSTTGELSLVPSFSKSEEERAVLDLQESFDAARQQYAQAYRTAAVGGIDTTADADAAVTSVKQIKRELASLRKSLSEDRARKMAAELNDAVQTFERSL